MTRTKHLCHPETVRVAASHQAQAEKIAAELAAIAATGMVLPGSITQRRTRCGRRNCGCHADPPRLHGPYWQWTRKIAARTICRWLSDDQQHDYQAWIDNDRRLRELLARLEALGAAALEADPRWQQRSRRHAGEPRTDVGTARLTCGQHPDHPASAQLTPKREYLTLCPRGAVDSARGSEPRGRPFESARGHGAGLAGREAVRKTAGRVRLPPRLHGSSSKGSGQRCPKPSMRVRVAPSRRWCSRLWHN